VSAATTTAAAAAAAATATAATVVVILEIADPDAERQCRKCAAFAVGGDHANIGRDSLVSWLWRDQQRCCTRNRIDRVNLCIARRVLQRESYQLIFVLICGA